MVAPSRRIKALGLDVMGTLVEPKQARVEHILSIYRTWLPGVETGQLLRVLKRARKRHLQADYLDSRSRWIAINLEVLERCGKPDRTTEDALVIHDRFTTDPTIYEVRPDMREFLEWAKSRVELAVISNQPRCEIERFLRHHDVLHYFDRRIIAAEEVRSWKPSQRFFRRAVSELGYHPREIVHVGNSLQHDVPGAKVVRTIIIVREGVMPRRGVQVRPLVASGMLSYARGPREARHLLERQRLVCAREVAPCRRTAPARG